MGPIDHYWALWPSPQLPLPWAFLARQLYREVHARPNRVCRMYYQALLPSAERFEWQRHCRTTLADEAGSIARAPMISADPTCVHIWSFAVPISTPLSPCAQVAKLPVLWVAATPWAAGAGRWATPAEAVLADPQSRQQPELTGTVSRAGNNVKHTPAKASLCAWIFREYSTWIDSQIGPLYTPKVARRKRCLQPLTADDCSYHGAAALREAGLPLAGDVPEATAAAVLDLTPGARAVHPGLLRDHLRSAHKQRRALPGDSHG